MTFISSIGATNFHVFLFFFLLVTHYTWLPPIKDVVTLLKVLRFIYRRVESSKSIFKIWFGKIFLRPNIFYRSTWALKRDTNLSTRLVAGWEPVPGLLNSSSKLLEEETSPLSLKLVVAQLMVSQRVYC